MRQAEFPVTRDKIFLAHGGVCALPARVARVMSDYAREATTGDQEQFVYPGMLDQGRKLAAQLLNCRSEEIALVGPTPLALSFSPAASISSAGTTSSFITTITLQTSIP